MSEKKQNQNGSSRGNGKSVADDLFQMLNPNNMLNNAQRVMRSAVEVLEEEIAAGILAAKRIEKKVIDVEDIKSNPENLMNRIRRDTHEALDIFLDAFASLSKQVGILTDTVTKENTRAAAKTSPKEPTQPVQVIKPEGVFKAGQKIKIPFELFDDAIKEPLKISLNKTDFTSPSGQKIPARFISLKPASVVLKPGEQMEITMNVAVPKTAKKGMYHSLLTAVQAPEMMIVISLEIK